MWRDIIFVMDQTELQKKISEYYAKLPKGMQEVFSKMEWLERLRGISMRYSLTESQIKTLGTETSLLMLGIIHPDEYAQILNTELGVSKEINSKIIDDVNLEIIKGWKGSIIEAYNNNNQEIANIEVQNKNIIDQRFSNLPKETQEIINKIGYQNSILEIGKKNNLSIEDTGKLEDATMRMITGVIHQENYIPELMSALNITKEKSEQIAGDVNDKILKGIRMNLVSHSENLAQKVNAVIPEPTVPVPPYKIPKVESKPNIIKVPEIIPVSDNSMLIPKPPVTLPGLSNESVFKTAGIEIENKEIQKAKTEVGEEKHSLSYSGIHLIEDNANLNINPTNIPTSMMGAKLNQIIANNIINNEAPHSGDKYREEI